MVYKQINRGKTLRIKNTEPNYVFLALLAIFVAAFTIICALLVNYRDEKTEEIAQIPAEESASEIPENIVEKPQEIDFQPIIDDWVGSVGGNKSILIYDLDLDEIVATYNIEESYNTASLYKLFVVYEGYRRLESGEWLPETPAGGTGYTVLECLDLAIRESNSPCAETLWTMIGKENLDEIIENDFGIVDSNISGLLSNVSDITKIMKIFYEHKDIKNELYISQIKDSFLNQPVTTYDWRRGLPSGFSKANVYNKVGWDYNAEKGYWNIYHDAAIVEFPEQDRHFIVVIMTNRVPHQQISKLGEMIEEAFFNSY